MDVRSLTQQMDVKFSTPIPKKNGKRRNLEAILSGINTGEVTRAAKPNFVGTTPDLTQSPQLKLRSKLTYKNIGANTRAKSIMNRTNTRVPEPFIKDNKEDRRMSALEYRNINLSDCLYHTM